MLRCTTLTRSRAKKYIAIDCEMVGVGIDGTESSLARVSVVNFYGTVELDEIVRQKERVVDYRTEYSGIRAADLTRGERICHDFSPFLMSVRQAV
jgi:RNA exonuclease 4